MRTKITVYNYREFDEKKWFDYFQKELDVDIVICKDVPSIENASLAKDSQCINIITTVLDRKLLEKFYSYGVRYITTRTIGYDHIDVQAAKELGIKVANAPYGPNGVADFTIMLMLMSIRKMKCIMQRNIVQDYTLKGIQGRELKDFTVAVVGTGRIGRTVIKDLSGFGCEIIAYDIYENDEVKKYATYVDKKTLFQKADLITFHTPLTEDNFHMINKETLQTMKDGVVIINTARGGLIDTKALIDGIESGKVGSVGLDVVEDEFSLYYYDRKSDILSNRDLSILKAFPNVTISHHMAFYTDNCVKTVVGDSLKGCKLFVEGLEDETIQNPWEIK